MTVSTQMIPVPFVGNGVATSVPLTFGLLADDDVVVYQLDDEGGFTVLSYGVDYTVTRSTTEESATVDFLVAPASGLAFRIIRQSDLNQLISIKNQVSYNAAVVEKVWDKLLMLIQETNQIAKSSLRSLDPVEPYVPVPGRLPIFRADGLGFENGPDAGDIADAQDNAAQAAAYASAAAGSASSAANSAASAAESAELTEDFFTPFATRAEAIAATIDSAVTMIWVRHDGLLLLYIEDATGTALSTNAGARKWSPAKGHPVYMQHWGAVAATSAPFALTDYTTQIRAAVAWTKGDLLLTGWFKLTGKVQVPNGCRLHSIGGRTHGGFRVYSDFTLADTAIIELTGNDGGGIGHLGMSFDQAVAAATGLRADLVQYPAAVRLSGTRPTIEALRIAGGYDGVVSAANFGGARFGIIESGCFNNDFDLTGALDFVHSTSLQVWPFGFESTATLTGIFYDGTGYALKLGQADGWNCSKFSTYRKKVLIDRGSDAILPHIFQTLQIDGDDARLQVISGRVLAGVVYTSKTTAPTSPSIDIQGGRTTISCLGLAGGETIGIQVTGGELSVNGGELFVNSVTKRGALVSAGRLELRNMRFNWPEAGARTVPVVEQSGTGVLVVAGCTPTHVSNAQQVVKVGTAALGNYVDARPLHPHIMTLPSGTLPEGQYFTRRVTSTAVAALATAGTSSWTYSGQNCHWQLDGEFCRFLLRFTATPTVGTGTGNLEITASGMPTPVGTSDIAIAGFQGFTFTGGRSQLMLRMQTTGKMQLLEYGPGISVRRCDETNLVSGTAISMFVEGSYLVR